MAYFTYGLNHPGNTSSNEDLGGDIRKTTASTFLTGTDVTYSGGRGSSALKLTGTFSATTGGYHNLYSLVDTSGAIATATAGVVNVKAVTVNTGALTDGYVYGGQFIAKHNHATSTMANEAALIGLEGIGYVSAAGGAGTVLGGSFVIRNEASTGTYAAGAVHRGIQITCDNNAGGNDPSESTGLAIWNMTGTHTNAIAVVNSGSGFTNFANFFSNDGAPAATGTYSSGVAANPTGYIVVKVGANTRYIYLFTTLPT